MLFNVIAGVDKRVHTFPKVMSPKVKLITWLEFEHAYFEAAV